MTTELKPTRSRLVFVALLAVHVGLVFHFAKPSVILSRAPLWDIDFPLHYYQVDRARRFFGESGHLWGYDPFQIAGNPVGTIEDVSVKTLELWVIALDRLGVHPATAFNLYTWLVHLLLPFVGWISARLFRLTRGQALWAVGLWIALWFFDSILHWVWYCGMISWALVSMAAVLLVALLYRALDDRAALPLALAALLAAFLALHHPFAAVTLFVPCAALYARDARRLPLRLHLIALATLPLSLAASWIWLEPALRFRHLVLKEDTFLRPTLDYLLYDYLGLVKDPWQTGPYTLTFFRVIAFAAGLVMIARWFRANDRRALPLGAFALVVLGLGYAGAYMYWSRVAQPYRHMTAGALAIAIPAGALLAELCSRATFRGLGRQGRTLVLLLVIVLVPTLVRSVIFTMPQLIPPPMPHRHHTASFPQPSPGWMGYRSPPAVAAQVRDWLRKNLDGAGRVVVQDYMLGEYLATADLPVLGGLVQRSFPHGDAHLFRLDPEGNIPDDRLRAYFERYAVRYVVMSDIKLGLERRKHLLKFVRLIGTVRVYETLIAPSYVLRGQGKLVHQGLNRLRIDDAGGEELILRFHYLESLRCRPGCAVERFELEGDRAGFIRVRRPPRRFEIYNSYERTR